MSFFSIVKLFFWLFFVPLCAGLIPYRFLPLHKRGVSIVLIAGYLTLFALFEIVAIPCMLMIVYHSFYTCAKIYTVVSLVAAGAGVLVSGKEFVRREKKELRLRGIRQRDREELFYWFCFVCIVAVQLYMAATNLFFDGDDAYYVVESLLAQQAGVMNTILPYTGMSTTLDIRHALSVITMWEAFIAYRTGVHATILAHTVLPLAFLPLTYLVYFQIAKLLFTNRGQLVNTVNTNRSKKEPPHMILRPIFMILIAVFMMFGNVSIYTPETFLMMRNWQGKSLTANFVLPLVFWILLWIGTDLWKGDTSPGKAEATKSFKVRLERYMPFIFLALVNMTAGICSSMGVVLAAGLFSLSILFIAFAKKEWKLLVKTAAAFVPSLVYIILYVAL